jgi:polar amino acid transport system permease protein
MEWLWDWCEWLNVAHQINYSVCFDPVNRGKLAGGLLETLKLSLACIGFSIVIGVLGAWLQGSHLRLTRRVVQGYIQFFRNTPPLVQLYFFFFAVGALLPKVADASGHLGPPLSNVAWAIISLSFFGGAFNVEIFRAGIEAVPKATVEAAESLGFTRLQTYALVVLPLALRISLPALNNNLVNLVKTTTLAYAIGVPELLYVSAQIWSDDQNVREMMNLLLVLYVAIVGALVFVTRRLERSLRIPGYNL